MKKKEEQDNLIPEGTLPFVIGTYQEFADSGLAECSNEGEVLEDVQKAFKEDQEAEFVYVYELKAIYERTSSFKTKYNRDKK